MKSVLFIVDVACGCDIQIDHFADARLHVDYKIWGRTRGK